MTAETPREAVVPDRQWAIKLPADLADRIHAEARARVIGRDLFIRHLLAEAMDALIPVDQLTRLSRNGSDQ